jgi:hypothetical protein
VSDLLAVILPIALVDSTSITPIALVPLATLLAGRRAYLAAFAFLAGLFVSYFAFAAATVFGLAPVFDRLNGWLAHRWHHPEPVDFVFELVIGLVLLVVAVRTARGNPPRRSGREVQTGASPATAFGFAFMLNVVGMPGAVPWFAALDQILRFDPSTSQALLAVTVYVTAFVLPLTLVVALRAVLGARGDAFLAAVKRFFDVWGRRVLVVVFLLLGLAMTVDAGLFILRGEPLVPIGWP